MGMYTKTFWNLKKWQETLLVEITVLSKVKRNYLKKEGTI